MATIVTRAGKGSPLTHNEVDANFNNLNNDKVEESTTITAGTGLTGGGDLSANRTISLANTAVAAGSYGSASAVGTFTVDAQGRLTAASNTNIAIANTAVSGLGTMSTQNANNVAITGGSINGTTVGASSASTGAFTTLSASSGATISGGNLAFTTTAQRITGDMSNATHSNRVAFQTSTANTGTTLAVIPNGTATVAQGNFYSSSDANNASLLQTVNTGLEASVRSGITGTGTYLPMTFYTGGSERVRIDTTGRVGIGTTSPTVLLQVANTSGENARFTNTTGSERIHFASRSSAGVAKISSENSDLQVYATDANALLLGTSNTERMRIDSSGNVGIGTASPNQKLVVGGNVYCNTGNFIANRGSGGANTSGSGVELQIDGTTYAAIRQPAAETLAFYRGSGGTTETMRIDSSGNVGIGTASPSNKLQVAGSLYQTGDYVNIGGYNSGGQNTPAQNAVAFSTNITNGQAEVDIWNTLDPASYANTGILFTQRLSSTTRRDLMFLHNNGNVGIGTTAPTDFGGRNLNITAPSSSAYASQLWVSGAYIMEVLVNEASAVMSIGSRSNHKLDLCTNDTTRMTITTDGEVRIAGINDQGAYNLQCNGTGVWGAGAYVNGSDARLKDDITTLNDGLNVVSQLRPVTFKYKPDYSKDQNVQTGFIAQELQAVLAGKDYVDGIVQAGPNHLNVAYQSLIPILTKAIQEQQAMIDELKAKVAALETK
jgi:hypothetical protein